MLTASRSRNEEGHSFQSLKTALHRRVVDAMNTAHVGELSKLQLREQAGRLAAEFCASAARQLPRIVQEALQAEILDEICGLGPLESLLNDVEISEILVNGPDRVSVERDGVLEESSVCFPDEAHLLRLIHRLVGRCGKRIDEASPMVEAVLPDGSRINAVIPPLALRGPTLSIRRGTSHALDLSDLVERGTLAAEMADFLVEAVRGRLNILICGEAGSGKTMLLNALARQMGWSERIVTIEQTAELRLNHPEVVALQSLAIDGRGALTPRGLLQSGLRMRPDRLILGELRDAEAFDWLEALNAGIDGSMATIRATDLRDAIGRLEQMVSPGDLLSVQRDWHPMSALHLLIQISRSFAKRPVVMRIAELRATADAEFEIEDIFVHRQAGSDESPDDRGTFYTTGYEPSFSRLLLSRGAEFSSEQFLPCELGAAQAAF